MTEMLPFLIGLLVGAAGGVFAMCLMAVARSEDDRQLTCTRNCDLRTGFEQEVKIK